MILMRAAHRAIVATAVGLPLLLAGSGMVLAKIPHKPHPPHQPYKVDQPYRSHQPSRADQPDRVDQQISRTSADGSSTITQITRSHGGSVQQTNVSSQNTTDDDD
jgi:hypothetical protein